MIIFAHLLKRLLRNKANLLFILVVPALLIGGVFGFGQHSSAPIRVGLVDLDDTRLTAMLAESLESKSPLVYLEGEEEIRSALAAWRIDYALVINPGFTDDVIDGREPSLHGYSIQETNLALPVKMNVEGFISAARNLAAAAGGEEDLFYRAMDYYTGGSFILESGSLGDEGKPVDGALGGLGLLGMTMLLLSSLTAFILLKDRENSTYYRVLAAPLTQRNYLLQGIFSFLVISLLQVTGVLLVVHYLFGIYLGPAPLGLFLVMAVFALLCVAFGVGLAGVTRSTRQAGTVASLLIIPMSMLGGLFWPRELMPDILQQIGQLMPTAYMIDAAHKVVLGSPLAEAGTEILIMLLYALVFFLLGSWRRADVARR